jgi:hypothetical protein
MKVCFETYTRVLTFCFALFVGKNVSEVGFSSVVFRNLGFSSVMFRNFDFSSVMFRIFLLPLCFVPWLFFCRYVPV